MQKYTTNYLARLFYVGSRLSAIGGATPTIVQNVVAFINLMAGGAKPTADSTAIALQKKS